jgi:multidrug resistance efflux pump
MLRAIAIPLLAIVGIVFAAYTVVKGSVPPTAQPPVIEPPAAPYDSFVAGSGLIEASSENIAVGSPVGALVKQVFVRVGDTVAKDAPLFSLDARELEAEMKNREAALTVAASQLARLRAGTRPEQIPPAQARVREAAANLAAAQSQLSDARAQLQRAQQLADARAMSDEELTRRTFAVQSADARVAQAEAMRAESQAQLDLLNAGTWEQDINVAEAQVAQAQAAIEALKIELDRRTVRAKVGARVLQVKTREGEFAPAGALSEPLMLIGTVSPLHVRVDVDEYEAWRVKAGSRAIAYARGNKDISTPLTFVRYEPYIVPKRSLTGASTERVDTRVLQIIFAFDPKDLPLFVGQQVDVYIQADPAATRRVGAATGPSSGAAIGASSGKDVR